MDNRFDNYPEDFNRPTSNGSRNDIKEKETATSVFRNRLKNFLKFHWNEFKYTVMGLIIAILFLTIGFFKTLLIIILYFLGKLIGQLKDGNPKILFRLENFFNRY
ncbi:DUF2273 domain-containing protein [Lagierella sp.]|uniref:DUF2273 domain-containing protein n=1 Tax=Lagierella sp. TaxID=2849657 RepID=UPI002620A7DD|nr:DUF2273 domain-containing protein [Lagierella sp.]